VTQQELLAIVKTLGHFYEYLYGKEFHLHTNHFALTWLLSFRNLEGQTAHWVQHLQKHNFKLNTGRGKGMPTQMHSLEDHVQKHAHTARRLKNGQTA
jgi:hypothetical protein